MEKTNILIAITNIIKNPITNIVNHYRSSNRINNAGEALEFYVKDVLCGSLNVSDINKKNKIYSQYFSYIGNQNNPPDIMIKNGDAFEIKKLESFGSSLALNSSYPKDLLHADSPMITSICRNCEKWAQKDMFYIVGVAPANILKSLWIVHGSCYAANREIYERIKDKIAEGIDELQGIELSKTRELGRVNKVDPLGITYLRIRGMWGIDSPRRAFEYLKPELNKDNFVINALILKDKYEQFPKQDRIAVESLQGNLMKMKIVDIKNPNNPASLLKAVLISFIGEGK